MTFSSSYSLCFWNAWICIFFVAEVFKSCLMDFVGFLGFPWHFSIAKMLAVGHTQVSEPRQQSIFFVDSGWLEAIKMNQWQDTNWEVSCVCQDGIKVDYASSLCTPICCYMWCLKQDWLKELSQPHTNCLLLVLMTVAHRTLEWSSSSIC